VLTIDGTHGEGGGQIVRSALALGLATATPFRIDNIRAGRQRPGLLRQHLTCVEAARTISNAEVEGAELGSSWLSFRPGALTAGRYGFAIGSAGSTLLVVQALLPALLCDGCAWHIALEGGTHNPGAPSFEFFTQALAPLLASLGARVTATLARAGFHPAGGGRIVVEVAAGGPLRGLELTTRGAIRRHSVTAVLARLPRSIGEREIAAASQRLGWDPAVGTVVEVDSAGPGNTVLITVEAEHVTEVFTACGARGVPAERVAVTAAEECAAYLATAAPVGPHLADQLIVPLALGAGGRFVTVAPTAHTHTQIDLLRWFTGCQVGRRDLGDGTWEVVVPSVGGGAA
jgi:RNA 3'-terminal phosphate cyclase (ATP)